MGKDMKATQEHLDFLDYLRESAAVNMFGARPYLSAKFGLDKSDAAEVLQDWMDTFEERHNPSRDTVV